MIKIEKIENGFKTFSDKNLRIKPIYDRLGEAIDENALYDEAEDIEVDGKPRFDYEETEEEIETIDENVEN